MIAKLPSINKKIMNQIYIAIQNLGGNMELLGVIGSYDDTLEDDEILDILEQYNKNGTAVSEVIFSVYDTPEDKRKRLKVSKPISK